MKPTQKSQSTASKFQQAGDLIDLFVILYEGKYNTPPKYNAIQAKYDVAEVVHAIGFNRFKAIIEFYFKIDVDKPGLRSLLYSYEEVEEMMKERESDTIQRKRLMEETRRRVEEYRREHGS